MDPDLTHTIAGRIAQATAGTWSLDRIDPAQGGMLLRLRSADGTFDVEVRPVDPDQRCYRALGEFAYSYRAGTAAPSLVFLDRAIDALHRVLVLAEAPLAVAAPPPEPILVRNAVTAAGTCHFPTPYERDHLERTVELPDDLRAAFRRDGHVLVRGALDRRVLLAAREMVIAAFRAAVARQPPAPKRTDAYGRSFTQITSLGLDDPAIGAIAHSRRIAKMAADLMGVPGVRIFCEDWLTKEPGADITPWHQDSAVMPFDAPATVTVWIPFQPVDQDSGGLRFARGSHRAGIQPIENISDVSEAAFDEIIRTHGWAIEVCPPLLVGDVSFHDGSAIHGAFPNTSDTPRYVLSLACFADGAAMKEPTTAAMRHIRDMWGEDLPTGAPAATRFWPLTYRVDEPTTGVAQVTSNAPALHLRATLLPGGGAPVDLWVQDGRIRFAPIDGAEELAPAGGVLTSGLVDCHTHLSFPHTPAMEQETRTPAFMNARRAEFAGLGVLALRDMGAASDHVNTLGDEPGLPRVHAAGMVVVPYGGFPFTPTAPAVLTRAFLERLEQGATWIKVFADWSNDWGGQMHTGFSERDEVTYPLAVLAEAVQAAHRAGGLVAAHCFTTAGAEVAIRAGVDSLEHGWGVDAAMVDEMAARGIAWIPLVGIAATMRRDAVRERDHDRIAWVESSLARMAQTLPYAQARGVRILAGTDWFPALTVIDEIRALVGLGIDPASAVGAGAWAARHWLGEPGIAEGAPADLVLYRSDPRSDLAALEAPALILSGGRSVPVAPPRQQRPPASWTAQAGT